MHVRLTWWAGLLVVMAGIACNAMAAASLTELSDIELQGREIYRHGGAKPGSVSNAQVGIAELKLSAEGFPCVSCHGEEGAGRKEGSLTIPPISWQALSLPVEIGGGERPGYNEASFVQAVRHGINPAGKTLSPAMPRFEFTGKEFSVLLAYLKRIGSDIDVDPGVTADKILLGSTLPLSGSQAVTGQTVADTLRACMARVNAEGGIYGRQLQLRTMDAYASPDSEHGTEAVSTFADLVDFASVNDNSKQNHTVPLRIAPFVGSSPKQISIVRLLPALDSQARAAVDYSIAQLPMKTVRWIIVTDDEHSNHAMIGAVRVQAERSGSKPPPVVSPTTLARRLRSERVDAVFLLGDGNLLRAVVPVLEPLKRVPRVVGLLSMLGRAALELPPRVAAMTTLATPFPVDDSNAVDRLSRRLAGHHVFLSNPGLQATACAAVDLFVVVAQQAGRHLTARSWLLALESLHEFQAPLLPPTFRFRPDPAASVDGAYMVGVDSTHQSFLPRGGWIDPAG